MPKVLLLDTEPHLFDLLKSKLEREGFEVFADEGSLSSLIPGAALSPDLVILGHHHDPSFILPDRHTPVILLGHSDSDQESDFPHLKMPFRPNDLVELARRTVTL
jgi:hypothetical protein